MIRYGILLLLALVTDGLQALLSAGLAAVVTSISAIPVLGQAGAPVVVPTGILISFATDVCISLTFGAGLLLLLAYNGMFYYGPTLGSGVVELIPGIDVVPGWTLLAITCIVRKLGEEGKLGGVGASVLKIAGSVTGIGALSAAAAAIPAQNQQTSTSPVGGTSTPQNTTPERQGRVAADLKNIDGIRSIQKTQYAA